MIHHLRAILALPFLMNLVVPSVLVATFSGVDTRWNLHGPGYGLVFLLALTLMFSGMFLFSVTVYLFATDGRGTLAPWSPTRSLVTSGPYSYVRNPMISGVLTVLLAEALLLGSFVLALWASGFWTIHHLYFVSLEEPKLTRRFGTDYTRYRTRVPRWFPQRSSLAVDERNDNGLAHQKW